MKTKFYNSPGLEGCHIELGYGFHNYNQFCSSFPEIFSINIPPHVSVSLYSHDNFSGSCKVIPNHGNKPLKIVNLPRIFNNHVRSINIECACKLDNNLRCPVKFIVESNTIPRNDGNLGYTYYKVICKERPSPHLFIIPDFGVNKILYINFQERLADRGISSLILDYRGIGTSQASNYMQYAEIIQDYRFVGFQICPIKGKPIVFGHGIGGAIAQLWAVIYKKELYNLILVNTAPYAVYANYNLICNSTQNWLDNTLSTLEYATIVANVSYNTSSKDCESEILKKDLIDSITSSDTNSLKLLLMQNPIDENFALAPKFICTPTLIIHGINDGYISISGSDALYALIKNSVFRKLKTGHTPQFSLPDVILDAVDNYLVSNLCIYN